MESYVGQIMQVGFNFAPVNWATCQGQTLSISQNTALYSLLGTTFGGNGVQTFQLPDLQGRVAVGVGQGLGLATYVWGQKAGTESETLTQSQMPMHIHTASFAGTFTSPTAALSVSHKPATEALANAGDVLAQSSGSAGSAPQIYIPAAQASNMITLGASSVTLSGGAVGGSVTVAPAGGSLPISILQPYLALTSIICLYGIFPTRS